MKINLKDGTSLTIKPRSEIKFSKEQGHSRRITFTEKGKDNETNLRVAEIESIK